MSTAAREKIVHLDGSHVFQNDDDRAAEESVAAIVSRAWRCEIHHFGALSPIDWYATRYGRIVGLLELKSRSHDIAKYPTVFFTARKWLALQLGVVGFAVPGIFVVRFTDALMWVPLAVIDARSLRLSGSPAREPIIDVPTSSLRTLPAEVM